MVPETDNEGSLRDDAESLLAYLVPRGEELLADDGVEEILPFGAVLRDEEEVVAVDPDLDEGDETEPDEIFTALLDAVGDQARGDAGCRAAAVCADVHVVREDIDLHTDAIRFFVETRGGEAVNVFLPYHPTEDGKLETGEMFAVEADPILFSAGG